jgi:flagellar motor switch/type III secretory pathway protein FliN
MHDAPAPANPPVSLAVELGRLNLSLAQVADLRPGDVLDLGRSADDPVLITSGGDPVAHGTLVSVDGGLGVRITRLFV